MAYLVSIIGLTAVLYFGIEQYKKFEAGRGFANIEWNFTQVLLNIIFPLAFFVWIVAATFVWALNRLKPTSSNKSTAVRILFVLVILLTNGFCYCRHFLAAGTSSRSESIEFIQTAILVNAIMLAFGTFLFCAERFRVPERVKNSLRRLKSPILKLFCPGSSTGTIFHFMVAFMTLAILAWIFSSLAIEHKFNNSFVKMVKAQMAGIIIFMIFLGLLQFYVSTFNLSQRASVGVVVSILFFLFLSPYLYSIYTHLFDLSPKYTLFTFQYVTPINTVISLTDRGTSAATNVAIFGKKPTPLYAVSFAFYGILNILLMLVTFLRLQKLSRREKKTRPTGTTATKTTKKA